MEAITNGSEQLTSKMNNIMGAIADTMEQLVEVFDRSIDIIADYGVGVAQRVKKIGIQFLKTLGFIDRDLYQLLYIKNHLRDILKAIDKKELEDSTGTLFATLQEMWDLLVQRINMDTAYYNNFQYLLVEDIQGMVGEIKSKL